MMPTCWTDWFCIIYQPGKLRTHSWLHTSHVICTNTGDTMITLVCWNCELLPNATAVSDTCWQLEQTVGGIPYYCCKFVSEHSGVAFPQTAFLDSAAYLAGRETTERIGLYGDIILGRHANNVFEVLSYRLLYCTWNGATPACCNHYVCTVRLGLVIELNIVTIKCFSLLEPIKRGWLDNIPFLQ